MLLTWCKADDESWWYADTVMFSRQWQGQRLARMIDLTVRACMPTLVLLHCGWRIKYNAASMWQSECGVFACRHWDVVEEQWA